MMMNNARAIAQLTASKNSLLMKLLDKNEELRMLKNQYHQVEIDLMRAYKDSR